VRIVDVDDLLTIGTMARRSGLSIRALRLYDGLGLLRPVDVDPATGYRRYAGEQVAQAVLIARLREADVPLPEVAAVLAEPDGASRRARLERWWAGREHDVARQRDLVAALSRRLEEEMPMPPITTHQIDAAVLAGALAAVLRCTSDDEELPIITGVLIEPSADALRLVATDKFRLAVWDLPATGPGGQPLLLDGAALGQLLAGLTAQGSVVIEVTERSVLFRHDGTSVSVPTMTGTYPAYRQLLPTAAPAGTVTVDRERLADALRAACSDDSEPVRLEPTAAGLRVWSSHASTDIDATLDGAPCGVALNGAFALDGLASFPTSPTVELVVSGPVTPLTLRAPGTDATYLLMPVRMDDPEPATP
jgi:DNA polymerase-3 subunit beta